MNNTLNICLSHIALPSFLRRHTDILMSPNLVTGGMVVVHLPDYLSSPHGDTLSEYAQLMWLSENFEKVCDGYEFLRIFHYRRFTSIHQHSAGQPSTNLPWARVIDSNELESFESDFSKSSTHEVYNTLTTVPTGVLGQYSANHDLLDYIEFTKFLIESQMMTHDQGVLFLRQDQFIPSCNIGIFHKPRLQVVLSILTAAAEFRKSPNFQRKNGAQRRSMGFLLERLHSFLLLQILEIDSQAIKIGQNYVLADETTVKATV